MINGFKVVENNTKLELTQGSVTIRFVPVSEEFLTVQSQDSEMLWSVSLINIDDPSDERTFTLDAEEKENISAFLSRYNLS